MLHRHPAGLCLAAIPVGAGIHAADGLEDIRATAGRAGADSRDLHAGLVGKTGIVVGQAIDAADRCDRVGALVFLGRIAKSGGYDLDPGGGRETGIAVGIAVGATHRIKFLGALGRAGHRPVDSTATPAAVATQLLP
ncbi:MAG: hypothetical protein U5K38_11270 [Woeseiaceae bacterium]|nr:hypothetical protein [Woeseiaceae bacterium]